MIEILKNLREKLLIVAEATKLTIEEAKEEEKLIEKFEIKKGSK